MYLLLIASLLYFLGYTGVHGLVSQCTLYINNVLPSIF